jgi:hypothetical protein
VAGFFTRLNGLNDLPLFEELSEADAGTDLHSPDDDRLEGGYGG